MVFLKPKIATWRYSRGSRVLAFDQIIPSSEDIKMNTDEESEDMDYDIPESELEAILQVILRALHDRNTEVRWSAAKGIGRVASRLPKSLTQDVINSILASNFSRLSGNNSWHGGCLAIAELSRRGFLLPECLSDVVNIICEALVFEERQGRHAQGANVRDAACYICWALARAFHPSDMKPHIAKLASALICTSLFDREINVRRAASAAFQENVGRQGTFPEGIPILTLIDYFSVGLRLRSYLDISVRVAAYKPYAQSIIEHLFLHKIFHWDEEIRDLAAEAVRRLACVDPDFVMEKLITIVVPRLKDPTPIVRQGAIYAFSGGCRGLFDCGFRLAHIIEKTVVDIPRENFALCATKVCAIGGELIRRSMVKFVKYASAVVPSAMIPIMEWLDVIELNCCDENGMLRKDMTEAAAEFFKFFVSSEEAEVLVMRSRTKYIRQVLSAESEPIRECGAALLSVLPVEILVSVDPTTHRSLADDAIEALILVTSSHGDIDALWASGRCACVTAIARIACKLGSGCMDARIIECASNALNDYTTDSHGDVGRILREGAMRALSKLIPLAARAAVDLSEAVDEAICKMVQQSCEKIDATRECAANVIRELLLDNCVHLVEKETLFAVYGSESEDYDKHFQGPSCFVYLAPLLLSKHYRYSALSGFVISAGGITESTQRDATDALLTSLSKIVSDSRELEAFLRCLSLIFSNNARVSRITIPLLCTLDHILSSQLLACLESNPDASPSLVRIAELAAAETASKSQTAKIRAGVMVMCNFLHFNYDSHVYRKAAAVVVRCLLSPIPRIRQITAERLYECLLADSSEGDESGRDSVLHLLAGTEWQSTSDKESIHDAACFVNRFLSVH
ncbi:hypothetical protein AB6A40_006864 [Gnathostoma spinigerum]|uniref:Tubulin-specific chaperone D n=1 Tax=Gnathostoma spinigerum TaxID=75299 RepID=A0ABD6EKS7_9BILA